MKSGRKARACVILLTIIWLLMSFTACKNADGGNAAIFNAGLGKNEVFRIGNESCTKEELMVYLTTVQNQYEKVYGAEIRNMIKEDITFEEGVKATVLTRIAQVKTMYAMAQERAIELSQAEQEQTENAANAYYNSLKEAEIELLGISLDTLRDMYREYALAEKIYQTIIKDINPEISDDEARILTVQQIFVNKENTFDNAAAIQQKAVDQELDFEELAVKYSDDEVITCSFGKGEKDQRIEEAVFRLSTDQISEVVETEEGYYIFKCISTFNREETDKNKIRIVERRREDAFSQEYDRYVESIDKKLNEDLWTQITLIHDSSVTTSDFFEVYEQFVYVEPFEG